MQTVICSLFRRGSSWLSPPPPFISTYEESGHCSAEPFWKYQEIPRKWQNFAILLMSKLKMLTSFQFHFY